MTTPKTPAVDKHPPIRGLQEDPSSLFPFPDGEALAENDWQYTAISDTVAALRNRYKDRNDVYVAAGMFLYYGMYDLAFRTVPDVYVVLEAQGNHRRDYWLVWEEGKSPDFVLEVASSGTWETDAGFKRNIYAAMDITEYWRFDPKGELFVPELVGERLIGGKYSPLTIQREETGILRGHSDVLGLDICVRPGLELRLYDAAAGNWLLTPGETEAARQAEAAARQAAEAALEVAEAERQREADARQAAEEENRRLREQLRSLQAEQ